MRETQKRNVPIYTKSRMADSIAHGILDETEDHHNIKFVLMGWPGPLDTNTVPNNPVKVLLEKAKTNGSLHTSNSVPCSWFDNMNSRQYIGFEDD